LNDEDKPEREGLVEIDETAEHDNLLTIDETDENLDIKMQGQDMQMFVSRTNDSVLNESKQNKDLQLFIPNVDDSMEVKMNESQALNHISSELIIGGCIQTTMFEDIAEMYD